MLGEIELLEKFLLGCWGRIRCLRNFSNDVAEDKDGKEVSPVML